MKKFYILIFLISIFIITNTQAKQYDVSSYYKTRYIGQKECQQFYTYHNGREHYVDTVCN